RTIPVMNPATEEVLGELPVASAADLDRALEAARRAWPVWRSMAPVQRGRILRRAAEILRSRSEEIARLATLEEGKTLTESRIEVGMAANIFEWYAEEGRRAYGRVLPQQSPGVRMTVVREPVGPVAAFAPWNFPLGNPARKLGAALGAGCPCIIKPPEGAPGRGVRRHPHARGGAAAIRARDRRSTGRGGRALRSHRDRVRSAGGGVR